MRSARMWINRHGQPGESYRFDVIGVVLASEKVFVRHVENAFGALR